MTPLDTELFNEFKRLDKLLRESRGTERGVSDYIDEMRSVPAFERDYFPRWKQDLDGLWRCRHIRNKLAHEDVSERISLCRQEDIEFLRSFYDRVRNGRDPLAQLGRARRQTRESEGCLSCVIWATVSALAIPCIAAVIRLLTQ
jgi:hypothetical protein